MSSPKAGKSKAGAGAAAKPAKAAAKPAAAVKRARSKPAAEISGEDKVHFVKAMWEGVKPKGEGAAAETPQVEVLRRIPAPQQAPVRQTPESAEAIKLAEVIEAKLAAGELDVLTPQAMQTLMATLVKLYSASAEAGERYPILEGRMAVTGTDAMIVCGALLKAVDLQVFELGMWQSWSGM
jgi:hypothetical protein